MYYSRHTLGCLSLVAVMGMASAVMAQTPQTLDGQMQQMQHVSPQLPPSVPPGAVREWPASPSMATGPEQGEEDVIDSVGGGAIPALPLEVQTMGGITFITGGVGDEEVAELKSSEHSYNLHILMNAPGGAFVSDVDVNVADATGNNILTARGAGPYFYAKLAPGSYTVELNDGTQSKKFPVKVKTGSDIRKVVQFQESGGVTTPHAGTATVE